MDFHHFIDGGHQIFEYLGTSKGNVAATAEGWLPFQKSWVKRCRLVDIFMVGAGAGGGGAAFSKAVGAAGAGGGGGASGAIVRARIHLDLLPEVFYLFVPQGGKGGTAGNTGESGIPCVISPEAMTSQARNIILHTSIVSAAGGQQNGNGGNASPIMSAANCQLSGLAMFHAIAGQGGSTGGSSSGANGTDLSATGITSAGAGGAGSQSADFAGGNVIPADSSRLTVPGGAAGPNAGMSGQLYLPPFFPWSSTGGAGGGSTNTAGQTGGRGGDAGPGSGGGGGGAGIVSGGNGGDGGHGFVRLVFS